MFCEYLVIKLMIELLFELCGIVVLIENVVKDYLGVYGVWIQWFDDGWQFVLNVQGDVWGMQFDVEVVNIIVLFDYECVEELVDWLWVVFEEIESGNCFVVQWGEYCWFVFVVIVILVEDVVEQRFGVDYCLRELSFFWIFLVLVESIVKIGILLECCVFVVFWSFL